MEMMIQFDNYSSTKVAKTTWWLFVFNDLWDLWICFVLMGVSLSHHGIIKKTVVFLVIG